MSIARDPEVLDDMLLNPTVTSARECPVCGLPRINFVAVRFDVEIRKLLSPGLIKPTEKSTTVMCTLCAAEAMEG